MAINWTSKPILTDEMDEEFRVATIDGTKLKWSSDSVPDVGDRIFITFNGWGLATVRGYCHIEGFVGLLVEPDVLPDWYVKQTKREGFIKELGEKIITIFGREFKSAE